MTINFYKTLSDEIVVNKAIELIETVEVQFNQFDLINLSLALKKDYDANYLQMDNKYYYIYNKVKDGKITYYYLKIDVLMTYKNEILQSTQFVDRNEFLYNKQKIDNNVETQVDVNKEYINLNPTFLASNLMPTDDSITGRTHFIVAVYK